MGSPKGKMSLQIDSDNKQNGGKNENTDETLLVQLKGRRGGRKGSLSSKNSSAANSRSNSKDRNVSNEDKESWTCDSCADVFQSDQSKLLECEYCNTHRCIKCLNLPTACYRGLSGRQDFPWFCNNCLVKTLTCLKEAKSIEEKCSEFMKQFEEKINSRIGKVEENLKSVRSDMVKFKDEIISEVKGSKTSVDTVNGKIRAPPSPSKVISEATKEVQSRVDRRNNILIFSVPESDSNLKDEVTTSDTNTFIDMCNSIIINVHRDDIINIKRIGKRNQKRLIKGEEKLVPRPLLLTLTEASKQKVMKNVHKLRYSDEPFRTMSVKHDMTQDERELDKALRDEAKDKQEKDNSGNFIYVVRGMPWERHIQKIKIRKTNEELNLDMVDQEGSPKTVAK